MKKNLMIDFPLIEILIKALISFTSGNIKNKPLKMFFTTLGILIV